MSLKTLVRGGQVEVPRHWRDLIRIWTWQLPSGRWQWELHWKDESVVSTDPLWLVEGQREQWTDNCESEEAAIRQAKHILNRVDIRRFKNEELARLKSETKKVTVA